MTENEESIIRALEENRRYRAIGTPEECQAAMEKQTKSPIRFLEPLAAQNTNVGIVETMCVMETNTAGGADRNWIGVNNAYSDLDFSYWNSRFRSISFGSSN